MLLSANVGYPITPKSNIRKLKQVENFRKAYEQVSFKFGGDREEYSRSALLTFERHLKLYHFDEEKWVSVFPLMLKKSSTVLLRPGGEERNGRKGMEETLLFHPVMHMFKN